MRIITTFLMILGLVGPASAQVTDSVDDPLALYVIKRVQFGSKQYCLVYGTLGFKTCEFDDMATCSEARLRAISSSVGMASSCERNPGYQPVDKE